MLFLHCYILLLVLFFILNADVRLEDAAAKESDFFSQLSSLLSYPGPRGLEVSSGAAGVL